MALALCLSLVPMSALAADSDFTIENGVLTKYNGPGGDVVIPDGVTSVGSYAFKDCTGVTSVTIPDSVTSIGDSAFYECTSLTSVTIPSSVTNIEQYAFSDTPWLRNMGDFAIVNGILIKYQGAGGNIILPSSVSNIGTRAFENCTGLTSVTIPDSVADIGSTAFGGCTGLTSVTIPDSVISIGDGAFYECASLTSVTISNSVTKVGYSAFNGCTGLTSFCVGLNNQFYTAVDGALFTKDTKILCTYPAAKQGAYTIPNSVTSIGYYAFYSCTGLTSVTIPNSVTSIEWAAFLGCTSLTSVTIPNSVTSLSCHTFADCTGLTSVTIPDSVTSIGSWSFKGCTSLTDVYYGGSEAQWNTIESFFGLGGGFKDDLTSATIHYNSSGPEYIYDTPDPAGDMALPAEELEQVDTQAEAVKAVKDLTASMTQTQKEAPTGIDLATLYAETAAAKVSTKKVTGSELLINAAALKDLQDVAQQTTQAVESALVSGGVTTARYMAKTATLSTSATGQNHLPGRPRCADH